MRRLRLAGLIAATLLGAFASPAPMPAAADVSCHKTDLRTGVCLIEVTVTHDEPEPAGRGAQLERRGKGGPAACVLKDVKLPCRHGGGVWSNTHHCYLKRMETQPPKADPVWRGQDAGAIYHCFLIDDGDAYPVWLAAAPDATPPPDPRVLAAQAIRSMHLKAVRIGIVPEPRRDRVGLVGLPTWMWVARPGPTTWGPITRTASAQGYTVTATARVDRIVWAMGDGTTVVCRTPGTAYADSYGRRSSPDCGHRYTRQGTYTVRATSYWTVEWLGLGETGEIPLNFTQAAIITMGEAQVLNQ